MHQCSQMYYNCNSYNGPRVSELRIIVKSRPNLWALKFGKGKDRWAIKLRYTDRELSLLSKQVVTLISLRQVWGELHQEKTWERNRLWNFILRMMIHKNISWRSDIFVGRLIRCGCLSFRILCDDGSRRVFLLNLITNLSVSRRVTLQIYTQKIYFLEKFRQIFIIFY